MATKEAVGVKCNAQVHTHTLKKTTNNSKQLQKLNYIKIQAIKLRMIPNRCKVKERRDRDTKQQQKKYQKMKQRLKAIQKRHNPRDAT